MFCATSSRVCCSVGGPKIEKDGVTAFAIFDSSISDEFRERHIGPNGLDWL